MAQITGNLVDPMGKPLVGADIRIAADDTQSVLYGISGKETTLTGGLYDFILNDGTYSIEVLFDKAYIRTAIVLIDGTVPPIISLEALIKNHATFIPSLTDS